MADQNPNRPSQAQVRQQVERLKRQRAEAQRTGQDTSGLDQQLEQLQQQGARKQDQGGAE